MWALQYFARDVASEWEDGCACACLDVGSLGGQEVLGGRGKEGGEGEREGTMEGRGQGVCFWMEDELSFC